MGDGGADEGLRGLQEGQRTRQESGAKTRQKTENRRGRSFRDDGPGSADEEEEQQVDRTATAATGRRTLTVPVIPTYSWPVPTRAACTGTRPTAGSSTSV